MKDQEFPEQVKISILVFYKSCYPWHSYEGRPFLIEQHLVRETRRGRLCVVYSYRKRAE